jgi:hypothetical protein
MPAVEQSSPAAPVAPDPVEEEGRWRYETACHEAGHLIAARVLAEEAGLPVSPGGAAALLPGGGGLTYAVRRRDSSKFDSAVLAAAGPAAGALARRTRPPRGEVAALTEAQPPGGLSPATYSGVVAAYEAGGVSDAETVRAYCTASIQGPHVWASRWRTVHATARRLVREHRREILAVAGVLYLRGIILPSEIENIAGRRPAQSKERP